MEAGIEAVNLKIEAFEQIYPSGMLRTILKLINTPLLVVNPNLDA